MGMDRGPDLHTIGVCFLGPIPRALFDFAVMLHFYAIIVSYALASAEAYASFFSMLGANGLQASHLILPLSAVLVPAIVLLSRVAPQIITTAASIKGSLLVLLVLVTAYASFALRSDATGDERISVHTNFLYITSPLLVSTVALGGAVNTMPLMFSRVAFRRRDLLGFAVACCLGVFVVFILNILWCFFVLQIVPQDGSKNSLQSAADDGEISTVPLVHIIDERRPDLKWISTIVTLFIMISVTVSYFSMGTGMKHTLDGYVKHWRFEYAPSRYWFDPRRLLPFWNRYTLLRQAVFYVVAFGSITLTAVLNPEGFLHMVEIFGSLSVNLETGVFIAVMLETSLSLRSSFPIPFTLPNWLYALRPFLFFFYTAAAIYAVLQLFIGLIF